MNRFVDFWLNQEETITRVRTAFYATLLVAGIEAWGLVAMARQPAPVYVVPGATKTSVVPGPRHLARSSAGLCPELCLDRGELDPRVCRPQF